MGVKLDSEDYNPNLVKLTDEKMSRDEIVRELDAH